MKEMIELTGLWENTDKNGNKYFTGRLGNAKIVIFKNTYKEKENQPDYRMYVAEPQKKEDGEQKQEPSFDSNENIPF